VHLLELRAVTKSYGDLQVLADVNLSVRRGELMAILGPSGCGKTTILRIIGGFVRPTSGRVMLYGEDIVEAPTNRRPFNTVFQDYALFPHMSVAGNVAYGLMVRGISRSEIRRKVNDVLHMVQLQDLAARYPAHLSGGHALIESGKSKGKVVLEGF
jgi:spermidine/putrescine transport system ATP-binding protein